ncbi:ABC transporter substrate-binding protein [Halosimplex sp. J119]
MVKRPDAEREPTRRNCLKYGAIVVTGTGLAGCTGDEGSGSASTPGATGTVDSDSGATDAVGTTAHSSGSNTETASDDGVYSVTMAPAGEVTFDRAPERWLPYDPGFADMGVALGQADGMTGIGQIAEYHTHFYDELPGVSVDREQLRRNDLVEAGMDKEVFYELDNDVHVIDPVFLQAAFDWTDDDLAAIRSEVGPFLGNRIFRRADSWHDYRYYTLYQAFEKMARLFQERARYEAFEAFHEEFISSVQARLPPADQRPTVLLTYEHTNEPSSFSPYRLNDRGTNKKQWRDLGVSDALAGTDVENLSDTNRSELDYENLLEIDPDVLLIRGHEQKSAQEFRDTVLTYMRDDPVASELTAVQNGRVYRGGPLKQGPIQNFFLTERAAKQLYPEEFGDVTDDTDLFDRQRIADIVNRTV